MGQSKDQDEMEMGREKQAKGFGVKKSAPPVSDTLPQGMKAPSAEGEEHMGGVKKGMDGHIGNAGLGAAVKLLNEQTERGAHAATVAGMKMDKFR